MTARVCLECWAHHKRSLPECSPECELRRVRRERDALWLLLQDTKDPLLCFCVLLEPKHNAVALRDAADRVLMAIRDLERTPPR